MEMWKGIRGYTNYMVSDTGRVKRIYPKEYILKSEVVNSRGYYCVYLRKDGTRKSHTVHKLVLETFICIRPTKMEYNHKDGIKTNNKLSNLEWITPSDNQRHAFKIGLKADQRGQNHPRAKLNNTKVLYIRFLKERLKYPQKKLAIKFDVSLANIEKIVQRKTWKHI